MSGPHATDNENGVQGLPCDIAKQTLHSSSLSRSNFSP